MVSSDHRTWFHDTQCPAHHLPSAWSSCPSPQLMESQSPLRRTSHCRMTDPRITTEPELLVMSVQVREPATKTASRENDTDSESTENSSDSCTVADGEVVLDHGLCNSEGERAPVPELSPERAHVPPSSPEWAPVPELSPERAPVPPSNPESSPIPEFSPERASVSPSNPELAPVPKLSPERAHVPELSLERAPVPEFIPESPEAHKCPPSHPLLSPSPLSSVSPLLALSQLSARCELCGTAILQRRRGWSIP